jgi:hypothetical protein
MNDTRFTEVDVLKSALGAFFKERVYRDAVVNLRRAIRENGYYKDHWSEVILFVVHRRLKEGEALDVMNNDANLPLDENSDDEAYKWLTLMLINSMGGDDVMIVEY